MVFREREGERERDRESSEFHQQATLCLFSPLYSILHI